LVNVIVMRAERSRTVKRMGSVYGQLCTYSNKSISIKTTHHADLLEPPFFQLLPLHHRLSNCNSSSQPSDRQHELSLVKALAQDVKRVRRRHPTPKQVKPIGENQGSRLEESGRGDYLPDIRNLNSEASIAKSKLGCALSYLEPMRNHEPWIGGNDRVVLYQHLLLLLGRWVSLRSAGVKQPPRERLYLVLLGCDWWEHVRPTDEIPQGISTD